MATEAVSESLSDAGYLLIHNQPFQRAMHLEPAVSEGRSVSCHVETWYEKWLILKIDFELDVQFAMRDGRRLCSVIKKSWSMYKNVNGVYIVSIAVAMSLKDTLPPSFRNSLRLC